MVPTGNYRVVATERYSATNPTIVKQRCQETALLPLDRRRLANKCLDRQPRQQKIGDTTKLPGFGKTPDHIIEKCLKMSCCFDAICFVAIFFSRKKNAFRSAAIYEVYLVLVRYVQLPHREVHVFYLLYLCMIYTSVPAYAWGH